MKSNRPLWSNMSWRTHKCLRTCWGNMHFCRRSQLAHWSSHCTKHRANVLFSCTSPVHIILKRHYGQNERYCRFVFAAPSHTQWQWDFKKTCPPTPPVIQLMCPCVLPSFLWWTTGGKNNLPLQPFSPQLPGNIIKKGGLTGPHARCHPPTTLRLSSAATLQSSTSDLFFFQADSCITPALVMQTDGPERYTEMTREERARSE